MKSKSLFVLTSLSLLSMNAFATSFQVLCAGSWDYAGPGSNITIETSRHIASDLNSQLAALAKTGVILQVSAPMASTGAGVAQSNNNGGSTLATELVCVTVTLQ